MSRVLGIDPGSRVTGYGVVDGDWGTSRVVAYGTIRLGDQQPLHERLVRLHEAVRELQVLHKVDEVAVERVFVARNADSALKLGHARGVVLLAIGQAGLPLFEYTPAQVKKSVTGSGRAIKGQVGALVRAILGLDEDPAEDAADALAIALTHQMLAGARGLLEAYGAAPRRRR
jgi:crossover junction endodeoxyribonuclease RuvC